jgi:hypothetical protein
MMAANEIAKTAKAIAFLIELIMFLMIEHPEVLIKFGEKRPDLVQVGNNDREETKDKKEV